MMRIQIRLTLIEDTGLAMRVLEQEGVERGIGELWNDEEVGIYSEGYPDIDDDSLYVRGVDTHMDDLLSVYIFDSLEERTDWVKAVRRGITELNEGSEATTDPQTEIIG